MGRTQGARGKVSPSSRDTDPMAANPMVARGAGAYVQEGHWD